MADRITQTLIEALGRAATEPAGLPLITSKAKPGLFAGTAPARIAAQRALDDGLLEPLADADRVRITPKGLERLARETSTREILEDFVRAIESRHAQVDELVRTSLSLKDHLSALQTLVDSFRRAPSPEPHGDIILERLAAWQASGVSEDCPLPELYRYLEESGHALTTGLFHDALRRLHEQCLIYLHPWTGPLYSLPEPAFALLVGHEIAYYASRRMPLTAVA